jgi:hypothetical protein
MTEKNPSAFDTVGAFNKYYNPNNTNTSSFALPLDTGKSIPAGQRKDTIASYNAKPVKEEASGFWGKTFAAMETTYNFATQAISFGLTLPEKTNPIWSGGGFDVDKVKEAWDKSYDISSGQSFQRFAAVNNPLTIFNNAFNGIVKTVSGGKLSGTDKFIQDHILYAANDFDIFDKKQRQEAFSEQVVGRVSSWTTDVVSRFFVDPFIVAGKAVKVYKGVSTAVKGTKELQAIIAGEKTGFKAKKVKATFESFLENTDNMNASDLFRVKAIRESSNPASMADLLSSANKITDKTIRHQTKADIIMMGMGDAEAATRLMETNRILAAKIGSLSTEVSEAKYLGDGIDKVTGQFTFDLVNKGTNIERTTELIAEYSDEVAEIAKKLEVEGSLAANVIPTVDKLSKVRSAVSSSQAFIDLRKGPVSLPVRVMTGFAYKRPKGWIDFTDNQSAQSIDNMLSRVRGVADKQIAKYQEKITQFDNLLANPKLTTADRAEALAGKKAYEEAIQTATFTVARKDELFAKYIDAVDPTARANAYQEIESELFSTVARQYGFSDEAVKKAWSTFSQGRSKAHNLIRERAYTGSADAAQLANKHIAGPEGVSLLFPMPLNETQLVKQLPMLDIDKMYSALNKYTRANRFEKGGKIYKTTSKTREIGTELIDGLDSLIKFEVLARVGYPIRNVTEGWMRIMTTVGPMAIIKQAGGGLVHSRFVGAPIKEVFKWNNTVKLNTKRAELMAERTVADNVDLIDNQIAEIDAMLSGKAEIVDKFGMGLNEVDGIKYQDALGATPEQAKAISEQFIKNASKIVDDSFASSNKALSRAYETSGDFVVINGADPGWVEGYIRVVNRQIKGSKITQQFLEGKSIEDVTKWMRGTDEGRKAMKDLAMGRDFEDIAEANLVNIQSLFPSGIADELLDIASKRPINAKDVEKAFGTNTLTRPQINAAQIGHANGTSAASKLMADTLGKFYDIAGELPESALVRNPLFVDLYRKRMEAAVRQAIDTYPGDAVPPAYLRKIEGQARQWARAEMRRTLYDTSERVDAAHMLKYIFPFFGAYADVAQKWGRIVMDDPSVVRKLQTVFESPDRMGLVEERDGIRYINIPGEWAKRLSLGISDRPLAIPKPSLNLIFQGGSWWNPGAGWFVQFGASKLIKEIPVIEQNALIKEILPYGPNGTGWRDLVIQSAGARKLLARFDPNDPMRANLTVTIAMEENHRYDKGERATKPTAKEIDAQVKGILALEAASRFVLPFATNTRSPYQFYIDEYQRMRQEDAENATTNFWNTYGDDYFIFTTSRSKNNTGINATLEAGKRTKELADLIAKQPEYGWFIVGDANTGEFSPTTYRKQRETYVAPGGTTKFRESQDPYKAIASTNVEKGWIAYNKGMDFIEAQRISRGVKSLTSAGAEDLAEMKRNFTAELEQENPDWGSARGKIDINKVNNFLKFAKETVSDPRMKDRPDIKAMDEYFQGREYVRQLLMQRESQTLTSTDNADILELWNEFTSNLIDENISFNRVFTRILENDDLRKGF